jgi:acetyltransferase-like isoleucine patch superfamily enzyme
LGYFKLENMTLKLFLKAKTESNVFFFGIGLIYQKIHRFLFPVIGERNKIEISKGAILYKVKKRIVGNNNVVRIGKGSIMRESTIQIMGNNNQIILLENCKIAKDADFYVSGNDNIILIRNNSRFNHHLHLCLEEGNTKIDIGEDCMFANTITIRTSDSHAIYNNGSNVRTNPAKSVRIGDHVWVAPKATIMKGVTIGNGSIIGYQSVVTKDIPENVMAAGAPACVIRENVLWSRHIL